MDHYPASSRVNDCTLYTYHTYNLVWTIRICLCAMAI